MVKKLALISVLSLCILIFLLVPFLNYEQAGMARLGESWTLGVSSVYAQANGILIEGADAIWETSTQPSEGLARAAEGVPARILAEYADSILAKDLQKTEQLSLQAASVSPRILVEYADSILSVDLELPAGLPQASIPIPATPSTAISEDAPSSPPTSEVDQSTTSSREPEEPETPQESSSIPLEPEESEGLGRWVLTIILSLIAIALTVVGIIITVRKHSRA